MKINSFLISSSVFRALAVSVPIFLCACALQEVPPREASEVQQTQTTAPSLSIPSLGALPQSSDRNAATLTKKSRLRKWADQQDRLYKVAAPLLLRNTSICKKKTRMNSGIVMHTKYSYSGDFAETAEQELGLSERLQIMRVMSGSGADKSGIRPGDVVLDIEGHAVPSGPKADQEAVRLLTSAMQGKSSVRMRLMRGGSDYLVNVPLTNACAVDVELGNADFANAYSDGKRSLITAGMLDFVRSDTELAIVVAKEIAHNLVMQEKRPYMGTTIDSLRGFGVSARSAPSSMKIRPYTAVRDATADKYSIYLLAKAGYDIDRVLPFWKRLTSEISVTQLNSYTALHPSSGYRFSVITAVTGVVKYHLKHRLPLAPH